MTHFHFTLTCIINTVSVEELARRIETLHKSFGVTGTHRGKPIGAIIHTVSLPAITSAESQGGEEQGDG